MLHLIRRFFGHLSARPLNEAELRTVRAVLPQSAYELFLSMSSADQRHAVDVFERTGHRADLAQSALLHDIGKRNGLQSAVARSLATVAIWLRIPLGGRWAAYRDHGPLGAEVLRRIGADALAVAFAEYHPGGPPEGFDARDWALLLDADNV